MKPGEILETCCETMEIPLYGVADVQRWKEPLFHPWIPEEFHPDFIFPQARSVIVIGLPVHLPVLESSPSIWYHELYKTVNSLLDQYTYRIASRLIENGYPSAAIPRDGYGSIEVLRKNPVAFFSHRHAAVLAGLGRFGTNNMVLTRAFGPRVRFGSIITGADIPPDPLEEEELCIRCNHCVTHCPVSALEEGEYPDTLTLKKECTENSAELNRRFRSPCGICIKVCPVGEDRALFSCTYSAVDKPGTPGGLQKAWDHIRKYGSLE
jgi:epoxyqueuosine reductase QueG